MNKLDENTALAILFANIRRKNRSNDLITIAKSTEYLTKLYGSRKSVAKQIGLSTEMIRQLLAVLNLPQEVQNLFSTRQLDSLDIAKELLALKDPTKQLIAAKTFADSLSKDARDIKRLIKVSNVSAEDAKKIVSDAKPKGFHIFMMDFENEIYQAIVRYAKTINKKPAELVREIVIDWLNHKTKINKK